MRVRFEVMTNDIVAFNNYHFMGSPSSRPRMLFLSLFCTILLVGGWVDWSRPEEAIPETPRQFAIAMSVIAGIFGASYLALLYGLRLLTRRNIAWNVKRLLNDKANKGCTGWVEMELTNSKLIYRDSITETTYRLQAIAKIERSNSHAFVYLNSYSAYIFPLDRAPEIREFVSSLETAWESRDTIDSTQEVANGIIDDRIQ